MDVAKRLSLLARKLAYGEEDIIASGPIPENATLDGSKITITFKNTGSGLTVKGESLKEFAIAGEDGNFKWAKAEIQGNTVVVWNDDITNPVKVRYAWADNPDEANLYNQEGLPATPFEIEL
jgi:sialate O-acetylesterase